MEKFKAIILFIVLSWVAFLIVFISDMKKQDDELNTLIKQRDSSIVKKHSDKCLHDLKEARIKRLEKIERAKNIK